MDAIQLKRKPNNRVGVSFLLQRFMMLMVAVMATMTFTSCPGSDENGEENENGGVAGKRLKSYIVRSPGSQDLRSEYSYNSDGTLKRIDNYYHASSELMQYVIITNYPDGTVAKQEQYLLGNYPLFTVWDFSNDSNKKPLKRDGTSSTGGVIISTSTVDFTFQNGRKIREIEILKDASGATIQVTQRDYNYDNRGKRTTTNITINGVSSQQTRSYNSDGTLQKATHSSGGTIEFTWENGKPPNDFDDYAQF
jgi:hypothetical protein